MTIPQIGDAEGSHQAEVRSVEDRRRTGKVVREPPHFLAAGEGHQQAAVGAAHHAHGRDPAVEVTGVPLAFTAAGGEVLAPHGERLDADLEDLVLDEVVASMVFPGRPVVGDRNVHRVAVGGRGEGDGRPAEDKQRGMDLSAL